MMNGALLFAGTVAVAGGLAHSYMGERLILIPLFRRSELPRTPFGDDVFTRHMLRGAWHFFTVMLWSSAGIFFAFAANSVEGGAQTSVRIVATYFGVFALAALIVSRGRHFAWLGASAIAVAGWWATL